MLFFLHTRHDVTQMLEKRAWLLSHKKRELENHLQLWICSKFQVMCPTNYTSLPEPISLNKNFRATFSIRNDQRRCPVIHRFHQWDRVFFWPYIDCCLSISSKPGHKSPSTAISGTLATYLGNVPSLIYHKRLSNNNNYACVDGDLTRVST